MADERLGTLSPDCPEGPVDLLLTRSAAAHSDRVAIRCEDRELTYAQLDAAATRCAAALRRCVPRQGTVVAITSVLSPDFVVGYYGILRAGQVAAPVNPYLREEQLAHVLGESGTEVALVDATGAARIAAVRDRLPRLRRIVVLGPLPEGAGRDVTGLEELLGDTAEPAHLPEVVVAPGDLACLHFTSGTTGAPKTVQLSHRNVLVNAVQVADAHRLDASSVALNHLPTFHPMHMNSAIAAGATQVLCPAPDPAESVRLANAFGATHYYSLPMRLSALAASDQLAGLRLQTVRMIASGGSALSPAAARTLADHFGVPVVQGYGLAETSPLTHSDDPADWRPGSVGRPVAGTEARVVDVDSRAVLGPGELGEVQVRGPQVMLGYRGESVPSCIDADGWLSTGDIGQIDATGRLVLADRLKDVFKRDNWLVSPTSVERVLERHPAVRDCLVVDCPHPLHGAVAAAFVVLAEGAGDDVAAIAAEVNAGLPYYQAVEHIEVVESIPRSPTGKAPRKELRARMALRLRSVSPSHGNPPSHGDPAEGRPEPGGTMITHVTKFTVKGDDTAEFERLFTEHAGFMAAQPGFVDYRMVRSATNPKVYLNMGRWKDAASHRAVVSSEEFRSHVKAMMPLVEVEADLYTPVSSADAEQ
ncbi:AMP-binding protein [Streptomyces thermodiastaticus]|jgi:long-chain acyl-CoA synthetase|uniref:AMP-binding protein n=1 Tax=Streptomyces thermodiastaticus TaxID=44061 RepID=UPI00167AC9E3|nr:AMP-binding protein [Streptomyces thermodiastaticus]MCE7549818.1 AMP-binding protein [Streptomyces thermodiastaticus]GHF65896.1 AMP-dependent synthetase [Streptomyces thermodiastaticus]